MSTMNREVTVGTELPPFVRHITQDKVNVWSGSGQPTPRISHHTSAAVAEAVEWAAGPMASARMLLGYATSALRLFFGADVFNHNSMVDLKYLRPCISRRHHHRKGSGRRSEAGREGSRVTVEIQCDDQKGRLAAVGKHPLCFLANLSASCNSR